MRKFVVLSMGLLSLLFGCFQPNEFRKGFVVKQASGNWKAFHDGKYIPELRLESRTDLSDSLQSRIYLDTTSGNFDLKQYGVEGNVSGNINTIGAGVSYFPWPNLSLDLGGDLSRGGIDVYGGPGPFKIPISDTFTSWGVNAGATYTHKLTDNSFWYVTGGYSQTDNTSHRVNLDFDGFYAGAGIGISLP